MKFRVTLKCEETFGQLILFHAVRTLEPAIQSIDAQHTEPLFKSPHKTSKNYKGMEIVSYTALIREISILLSGSFIEHRIECS